MQHSDLFQKLSQQYGMLYSGWGKPNVDIVFIGDAPGKKEMLTGEPFSDISGRFFDELLHSIALPREVVYITNVLKFCPEKRSPNKREIADFTPLLLEELTVIRPQIVATLGSISLNVFLPLMKISEVHGIDFKISLPEQTPFILMPLYHPAAAMHNGKIRPLLKADFLKLSELIQRCGI